MVYRGVRSGWSAVPTMACRPPMKRALRVDQAVDIEERTHVRRDIRQDAMRVDVSHPQHPEARSRQVHQLLVGGVTVVGLHLLEGDLEGRNLVDGAVQNILQDDIEVAAHRNGAPTRFTQTDRWRGKCLHRLLTLSLLGAHNSMKRAYTYNNIILYFLLA